MTRAFLVALAAILTGSALVQAQGTRWLPDRERMPDLFAGARDPVTKAHFMYVGDNPNGFGRGVEVEVALGTTLPVVQFAGSTPQGGLLIGIEAVVFARFGLQVLERELIATDWGFAVPFIWRRNAHWFRVRYHHTSNHMGDEYSRRFEDPGVNFSRDAIDALARLQLLPWLATHAGIEWAYNVHPEASGRWLARGGAELMRTQDEGWLPYASIDIQTDEDTEWEPMVTVQVGVWLPKVGARRRLRFAAEVLEGPSPVAQFQSGHAFQLGIGIFASL